jgi:hypothetical protein
VGFTEIMAPSAAVLAASAIETYLDLSQNERHGGAACLMRYGRSGQRFPASPAGGDRPAAGELLHLDATLSLFAPNWSPAASSPKAERPETIVVLPRPAVRLVLSLLRTADRALTTRVNAADDGEQSQSVIRAGPGCGPENCIGGAQ